MKEANGTMQHDVFTQLNVAKRVKLNSLNEKAGQNTNVWSFMIGKKNIKGATGAVRKTE